MLLELVICSCSESCRLRFRPYFWLGRGEDENGGRGTMEHRDRGTILLVEDEIIIALAEKAALERRGHSVIVGSSGERALRAFCANSSIDVAVLDITLGAGIDGVETARFLLQIRSLPIIFLSSLPIDEIERQTADIPAIRLSKPCSDMTLIETVEMALRDGEKGRTSIVTAFQSGTLP